MLTSLLILQAINATRLSYHLPPLKPSQTLQVAAQAKVKDEARYKYFAHVSPSNKDVWDFIGFSHGYTVVGENLSKGFNDVPTLVSAWMASPTHRKNILDTRWKDSGVGVTKEGNTYLVSEDFGD